MQNCLWRISTEDYENISQMLYWLSERMGRYYVSKFVSESGKFQLLKEICETIYEKRERVLVFTQFKSVVLMQLLAF